MITKSLREKLEEANAVKLFSKDSYLLADSFLNLCDVFGCEFNKFEVRHNYGNQVEFHCNKDNTYLQLKFSDLTERIWFSLMHLHKCELHGSVDFNDKVDTIPLVHINYLYEAVN